METLDAYEVDLYYFQTDGFTEKEIDDIVGQLGEEVYPIRAVPLLYLLGKEIFEDYMSEKSNK